VFELGEGYRLKVVRDGKIDEAIIRGQGEKAEAEPNRSGTDFTAA